MREACLHGSTLLMLCLSPRLSMSECRNDSYSVWMSLWLMQVGVSHISIKGRLRTTMIPMLFQLPVVGAVQVHQLISFVSGHAVHVSCRLPSNLIPSCCYGTIQLTICLVPAPIKSLPTSLPGELRFAPHAHSPGWREFQSLLKIQVQ